MIYNFLKGRLPAELQREKKTAPPIQIPTLPETLVYVFRQPVDSGDILVEQHEQVLRGQALTSSNDYLLPPVHAGSSGVVTEVSSSHITIRTDGLDECITPTTPVKLFDRDQLVKTAHLAGLIGQGGAGYPLAAKLSALSPTCHLLLVNAAECDPSVACDDGLMNHHADEIINSIHHIAALINAHRVCIGIEDNKPEAAGKLKAALASINEKTCAIDLVTIPARYPSGAERTLLRLCSQRPTDATSSLAEDGVLSMNIASCYAFGQALKTGMPCTERVTTVVAPDGLSYNFSLRLGTPLNHVYKCLNVNQALSTTRRITVGGHMMYRTVRTSDAITQDVNCITFDHTVTAPTTVSPCIRCGACADICPEQLMPQHLHTYAVNFNRQQLSDLGINRCIECRCCDVVCPSHIPLAAQFHHAKKTLADHRKSELDAIIAKKRFDKRMQRLAARDSQKKRQMKQSPTDAQPAGSHKALIAAALARKQQKNKHSGG